MAQQPLVGQGLLIVEASQSPSDTPHSVALLLDEWSTRRRDLYLTMHNNKRQTSMPPDGFEPTILVSERPQTHALDRAATGIVPSKTAEAVKLLACFRKVLRSDHGQDTVLVKHCRPFTQYHFTNVGVVPFPSTSLLFIH
jgi:hypothetical protein